MRKFALLLVVALFVAASFWGLGNVTASKPSIAEKFSNPNIAAAPLTGTYKFDPVHSYIGFSVRHLTIIDIPGQFNTFEGTLNYNADDVTKSSVNFSVETASVETRNARRNGHLKSPDFFNSAQFPKMTFKSTKVEKHGNDLKVTGEFTLRDVTKTITIPISVLRFANTGRMGYRAGIMATTSINRRDYNVNYGTPAVVGDKVNIILNIEAIKQ